MDTDAQTQSALSDETQHWLESRTVKAALVAMLPSLARLFGIEPDVIAPYTGELVTILMALLTILYRISATKIIR